MLTTGKEITGTKKVICVELTKMQKAFYGEEMLQYHNEEHLYWEQFDLLDMEIITDAVFNRIIGLEHSNIDTHGRISLPYKRPELVG